MDKIHTENYCALTQNIEPYFLFLGYTTSELGKNYVSFERDYTLWEYSYDASNIGREC